MFQLYEISVCHPQFIHRVCIGLELVVFAKFIYSEKATKLKKKSPNDFNITFKVHISKKIGSFFQNFVAS